MTYNKKQGRPDFTERPRSAALLARSFSPLPVPTGGADFPLNHRPRWALTNSKPSSAFTDGIAIGRRLRPTLFQKLLRRCNNACQRL